MNCKKAWSQKFIIENTNRSFYDNDFKKHRKQLLLDTELSKMPETMPAAEAYLQVKVHEKAIDRLNDQAKEIRKQLTAIQMQQGEHRDHIYHLKHGGRKREEEEKRKFIMPCPGNDCRGYLSTQYKCEICKLYTCPDCFEIIGHTKADEHTCNEDSRKSADLIKKDTKPCPTCGTRIFKISGCDQMWCTSCQVAFSWKTGHITRGVVHNPHFYQHQRAVNGGTAPRNPGDVVCGGICSFQQLRRNVLDKYPSGAQPREIIREELTQCHRFASHVTNYELPHYRDRVRTFLNNELLRIEYLNKEKTKEELATAVFRADNLRKKYVEILHIYELLSVVAIEGFATLRDSKVTGHAFKQEVDEFMTNYKALCEYCNTQFAEISAIFNHNVSQINTEKNFEIKKQKFTIPRGTKEVTLYIKPTSSGAGGSKDPL